MKTNDITKDQSISFKEESKLLDPDVSLERIRTRVRSFRKLATGKTIIDGVVSDDDPLNDQEEKKTCFERYCKPARKVIDPIQREIEMRRKYVIRDVLTQKLARIRYLWNLLRENVHEVILIGKVDDSQDSQMMYLQAQEHSFVNRRKSKSFLRSDDNIETEEDVQ